MVDSNDPLIQYVIMRKDLNKKEYNKGALITQGSHGKCQFISKKIEEN